MATPQAWLQVDKPPSSLYRKLIDSANRTQKYYFAFKAITLLPVTEASLTAYADSVPVKISEGASGDALQIHADIIYLYSGSHFIFPGRTITICARLIILVGSGGDIIFDLAGTLGATPENPSGTPGSNGSNGFVDYNYIRTGRESDDVAGHIRWRTTFEGGGDWTLVHATDGQPGTNGKDGGAGSNAGSFTLVAEIQDHTTAKTGKILANIEGGPGQGGGDGGLGGKGGDFTADKKNYLDEWENDDVRFSDKVQRPPSEYDDPAKHRGHSGKGGDAGATGATGTHGTYSYNSCEPSSPYSGTADVPLLDTLIVPMDQYKKSVKIGKGGGPDDNKGTDGVDQVPDDAHRLQKARPKVAVLADVLDPSFLSMLVLRLNFTYDMLVVSKPWVKIQQSMFTDPKTAINPFDDDFRATFTWLSHVKAKCYAMPPANGTQPASPTPADVFIQSVDLLTEKFTKGIDGHNNALNMVPWAGISLHDIKSALNALVSDEANAAQLAAEVESARTSSNDLADKLSSISSKLSKEESDLDQIVASLKKQAEDLVQMDGSGSAVEARKAVLLTLLTDKTWSKAAFSFKGCSNWSEVLSSLANVLMFAPAKASSTFTIGSLVSVGSSLLSGAVTYFQNVQKDYLKEKFLEDKFLVFQQDVQAAQYKDKIGEMNTMLKAEGSTTYASRIIADRDKFLQAASAYFSASSPEIQKARQAFNSYLEAVQARNSAIHRYNETVVVYYKLLVDHAGDKITQNLLRGSGDALSNPNIDLLFTYFHSAAQAEKGLALKSLYDGVRAYCCASLDSCAAFDEIAKLQTLDNVNSRTLDTALNALEADARAFKSKLTYQETTISLVITADSDADTFNQLKEHGTCDLEPDPSDPDVDINEDWWDVRLAGWTVELVGARGYREDEVNGTHMFDKDKPANPPADATDSRLKYKETKRVRVNIKWGPTFIVYDQQLRSHEFRCNRGSDDYIYSYTDAADVKTFLSPAKNNDSLLHRFKFADNDGADVDAYSVPLASPLSTWTLSVHSEPGKKDRVDLKEMTAIRVSMTIKYRTDAVKPAPPVAITMFARTPHAHASHSLANEAERGHKRKHRDSEVLLIPVIARRSRLLYAGQNILLRSIRAASNPGTVYRSDLGFRGNVMKLAFPDSGPPTKRDGFDSHAKHFVKLGKNGRDISAALSNRGGQAPDPAVRSAADTGYAQHISDMVNAYRYSGNSTSGFNWGTYQVGKDFGHQGFVGGVIHANPPDIRRLLGMGANYFFAAFPNVTAILLDQNHTAGFSKATDKGGYFDKNWHLIAPSSKTALLNNADPVNRVARVGVGSYVGVARNVSFQHGTLTVSQFDNATTKDHALIGTHSVYMITDSQYPGELYFAHVMNGEHPYIFVEFANVRGGEKMAEVQRRSAVDLLRAMDKNTSLFEEIRAREPGLLYEHLVLNAMWEVGGRMGVWLKDDSSVVQWTTADAQGSAGQDIKLDGTLAGLEGLPTTTEPSGFFENDRRSLIGQDFMNGQQPTLVSTPLTDKERKAMNDLLDKHSLRSAQPQDLLPPLTTAVTDFLSNHPTPAAGEPLEPASKIVDAMEASSGLGETLRAIVHEKLLSSNTIALLKSKMRKYPDLKHITDPIQKEAVVHEAAQQRVVERIVQPGGLASSLKKIEAEKHVRGTIAASAEDLSARLNSAITATGAKDAAASAAFDALKNVPVTDPSYVKLMNTWLDAKREAEDAKEEERDARELTETRDEADEREKQFDDERDNESKDLFGDDGDGGHDGNGDHNGGGEHGGGEYVGGGGHHRRMRW